jgi:hypothetical protein
VLFFVVWQLTRAALTAWATILGMPDSQETGIGGDDLYTGTGIRKPALLHSTQTLWSESTGRKVFDTRAF